MHWLALGKLPDADRSKEYHHVPQTPFFHRKP